MDVITAGGPGWPGEQAAQQRLAVLQGAGELCSGAGAKVGVAGPAQAAPPPQPAGRANTEEVAIAAQCSTRPGH